MKLFRSSIILLAICGLAFSSCKKSGSKPSTSVSMSLKFNGAAKSTSTVIASSYASDNTLQVIGSFNGTEAVSLMIENAKVGTVNLPSDEVIASYSVGTEFATTYLGTTGSITISSLTADAVSGTFQFSGTNSSEAVGTVTEGKFWLR